MKFERNILALKATLHSLGFEQGLEDALRSQICFQPEKFTITSRLNKDPDVMDFVLFFEMHDSNGYACRYYDAILRKRMPLADNIINEVNVPGLDQRMSMVDWNLQKQSAQGNRERETAIDAIITDLKKLEANEDGRGVADLLKVKYWPGTAVEEIFGGSNAFKGRQEISQRFYFFDGRSQITVEEAYRYLYNRWLEKELNTKKKQTEQSPAEPGIPTAEGGPKKSRTISLKRKGNSK